MNQISVRELLQMCQEEVAKGNGNRLIVISDDNEGNGYHGLFYKFKVIDEDDKEYYGIYDSVETDIDKVIVLG